MICVRQYKAFFRVLTKVDGVAGIQTKALHPYSAQLKGIFDFCEKDEENPYQTEDSKAMQISIHVFHE